MKHIVGRRRRIRALSWMIAGVIGLSAPAWAGDVSRHSGAIATVDRAAGTIVVEEVGPWRTRGGETVTTRRTFAVTRENARLRAVRVVVVQGRS